MQDEAAYARDVEYFLDRNSDMTRETVDQLYNWVPSRTGKTGKFIKKNKAQLEREGIQITDKGKTGGGVLSRTIARDVAIELAEPEDEGPQAAELPSKIPLKRGVKERRKEEKKQQKKKKKDNIPDLFGEDPPPKKTTNPAMTNFDAEAIQEYIRKEVEKATQEQKVEIFKASHPQSEPPDHEKAQQLLSYVMQQVVPITDRAPVLKYIREKPTQDKPVMMELNLQQYLKPNAFEQRWMKHSLLEYTATPNKPSGDLKTNMNRLSNGHSHSGSKPKTPYRRGQREFKEREPIRSHTPGRFHKRG